MPSAAVCRTAHEVAPVAASFRVLPLMVVTAPDWPSVNKPLPFVRTLKAPLLVVVSVYAPPLPRFIVPPLAPMFAVERLLAFKVVVPLNVVVKALTVSKLPAPPAFGAMMMFPVVLPPRVKVLFLND